MKTKMAGKDLRRAEFSPQDVLAMRKEPNQKRYMKAHKKLVSELGKLCVDVGANATLDALADVTGGVMGSLAPPDHLQETLTKFFNKVMNSADKSCTAITAVQDGKEPPHG